MLVMHRLSVSDTVKEMKHAAYAAHLTIVDANCTPTSYDAS